MGSGASLPDLSKGAVKKILFLTFGHLSFFLGIAGIFLPVLPTTPFLLLAAFCYMQGSVRLHSWLTEHRILGGYLKRYMENRAMTRRDKIISISVLWAGIAASIIFFN